MIIFIFFFSFAYTRPSSCKSFAMILHSTCPSILINAHRSYNAFASRYKRSVKILR